LAALTWPDQRWEHIQEQLDILVDQQRIMQECTATAERMLETAAALLQAAQQVRRPWDNTDAHGLSSLARRIHIPSDFVVIAPR